MNHKTRIRLYFLLISLTFASCAPPHELSSPEEAWLPERLPDMKEYVMVEYVVRPINCELRRLAWGEEGLRWKALVRFEDGTIKEYWAYKIHLKNSPVIKFYAPIPHSLPELMLKGARILLLSHDQSERFAYVYTLDGKEHKAQVNDEFKWEMADEIKLGLHVKQVKKDSQQDWQYREQTVNEIVQVLKSITPEMMQRIETYVSLRRKGQIVFSIVKTLEIASQYFTGVLFSSDWISPLYSLGIFQGVWLLQFILQPDVKTTPEYYGALMTQRQFAVVMTKVNDSLMRIVLTIRLEQQVLAEEVMNLRKEVDALKLQARGVGK
jgi:hypothetical protein